MKNYLNQNTIIEKIINIISFEIISISIIPYISAKLYIVLFDDQDKAFSGGLGALGPWGLGALGPWGLGAWGPLAIFRKNYNIRYFSTERVVSVILASNQILVYQQNSLVTEGTHHHPY